jgi:hypothetical protein
MSKDTAPLCPLGITRSSITEADSAAVEVFRSTLVRPQLSETATATDRRIEFRKEQEGWLQGVMHFIVH